MRSKLPTSYSSHAGARWSAVIVTTAMSTLGLTGCGADPASLSKSLDSEHVAGAVAEQPEEDRQVPSAQASRVGNHPRLDMTIESELALERYAHTTAKGNVGCPGELDRPPFTIAAGETTGFCLDRGEKRGDSIDTTVDVTYKIVDDHMERVLWIKVTVPAFGFNKIRCGTYLANMSTDDPGHEYSCVKEWLADGGPGMNPMPKITFKKDGQAIPIG